MRCCWRSPHSGRLEARKVWRFRRPCRWNQLDKSRRMHCYQRCLHLGTGRFRSDRSMLWCCTSSDSSSSGLTRRIGSWREMCRMPVAAGCYSWRTDKNCLYLSKIASRLIKRQRKQTRIVMEFVFTWVRRKAVTFAWSAVPSSVVQACATARLRCRSQRATSHGRGLSNRANKKLS